MHTLQLFNSPLDMSRNRELEAWRFSRKSVDVSLEPYRKCRISMLISTDSLKISIDIYRFSWESVEKSLEPYQNNGILRIRFPCPDGQFSSPHALFYHPPHNRQNHREIGGFFLQFALIPPLFLFSLPNWSLGTASKWRFFGWSVVQTLNTALKALLIRLCINTISLYNWCEGSLYRFRDNALWFVKHCIGARQHFRRVGEILKYSGRINLILL